MSEAGLDYDVLKVKKLFSDIKEKFPKSPKKDKKTEEKKV
jgi:hypothetical protein